MYYYACKVIKDIRISPSLLSKEDYAEPIELAIWQILTDFGENKITRISLSIRTNSGVWSRFLYLYADSVTDSYLHNSDYTAEAWVNFTVAQKVILGGTSETQPFYWKEEEGIRIKNLVIYDKLADKSVTSDKLADKSVTSDKLADKFLPNYKDLFVLSESISSSRRKKAEKYCQIVNRLVKRVYIDFSTISDDYIKDENGLPSLFLRQIMYNFEGNENNRYTLWLTVERTDGNVTSGVNFHSSDILVGVYSLNAGIRAYADLDYRVFPLLSDDRGEVYFSPYKEILLNLSALENFPMADKSDSELRDSAYLENIFSADSIVKKNPSYGVYNTSGKVTESTSNGGAFMEVNENYSYKIVGMLENTYVGNAWKGLVLYYSDVPHVEDYSELFLGVRKMSFDSTGAIFTPVKGAKIAYFYTTNADKYYVTRIDHVEFPRSVKPLEDYTMFVLGDSLSMNGQWATKVAELTGIQYSQALNNKAGAALSVGGTSTGGNNTTCGFMRCKTLIEQNYIQNAGEGFIVVLQNVNDGAWTFDDTSRTFRADNYITDNPVLVEEFNSDYLNSISSEDRNLNTVLQVLQKSDGKILTIDNLPTREGDITIKVGWSGPGIRSYNVHVVPQSNDSDTLRYVLDRILEYDYTGITDIEGEDEKSVIFAHGHVDSYPITLDFTDTGDTGMTCSISDTSNAKYVLLKFFNGDNLESDWINTSKWLDKISTSSAWKSIIEWLQKLYPKLKIFIMNAPAISKTKNDYLMENGLYDSKRFNDDLESSRTKRLSSLQGVADYYYLTLIDVWGHCGIHLNNLTEYYNETANVHPKDAGYERWGEYIASVLCRELPNKF